MFVLQYCFDFCHTSSILWYRLELQSNSKIEGNDRTLSSVPSHFLCLDNSSFLKLLSHVELISSGEPVCIKQSEPFSALPGNQLWRFSHTLPVTHFSCLMSPSCLYPYPPAPGAQTQLLNDPNCCLHFWEGTYCSRIPLSVLLAVFSTFSPSI